MGKRFDLSRITCACAMRTICCLVITAASCAVLFSVLGTKHKVNDCWLKSDCLLFGDVSRHETACRKRDAPLPTGGPVSLCYFCALWATVQLVLALLMTGHEMLQCCRTKPSRGKTFAVLELVFCSMSLLTCLIMSTLLTAGTQVFCDKLLHHWNDSYWEFPDAGKPSGCSDAYILNDMSKPDGAPLKFQRQLVVGQAGAWLCTIAWTVYVALAAFTCSQRKHRDGEMAVSSQRFKRLQEE